MCSCVCVWRGRGVVVVLYVCGFVCLFSLGLLFFLGGGGGAERECLSML